MGVLLLLAGLFVGSVWGGWYWVRRAQPSQAEAYWFQARGEVAGVGFSASPLDEGSLAKLATTNVVNGFFTNTAGFRSAVFLASWGGEKGGTVLAVDHTPDLCWAHQGWQAVEVGQPREVSIPFAGGSLPFECRVFESPGGGRRELVVWCSLLGGRVMPQLDVLRLTASESTQQYTDHASRSVTVRRRLKLAQFWASLTQGTPTRGNRQFVRYSVPVAGDWREALQTLIEFGPRWLQLNRNRVGGRDEGTAKGR